MDLLVRSPNCPVLAVVVDFASLVSEESLFVKSLRIQVESETNQMGLLIRGVDETVATVVTHSLHRDVALDRAILHSVSGCDLDYEPVEVLDQVALTSTAKASWLRREGD